MDQLSFAPGNKPPQDPEHPMFTAYETKFYRGRMVKVPVGNLKGIFEMASQKAGDNFHRLGKGRAARKALRKQLKEEQAGIEREA